VGRAHRWRESRSSRRLLGKRGERPRPGDPVRCQAAHRLEARQRLLRRGGEAPVDGGPGQAEGKELELERRDIPADGADAELALAEQRPSERTERGSRRRPELPVRGEASLPLKRRQTGARHRPVDAVDRGGIKAVRTERDLERGNPRAGCGCGGTRDDQCGERDGSTDQQAVHSFSVGRSSSELKRVRSADAYFWRVTHSQHGETEV